MLVLHILFISGPVGGEAGAHCVDSAAPLLQILSGVTYMQLLSLDFVALIPYKQLMCFRVCFQQMKCLFDGRCKIDVNTRRFCPFCRLKQCFAAGMKKDLILGMVLSLFYAVWYRACAMYRTLKRFV